ncbi:hypothetical protein D3C73_564840 [compost metagenome]
MFLTSSLLNPRFSTRNMAVHVNDGNEISIDSHVRSHSKALNIKYISLPCERKNDISCAHTRENFLTLSFLSTFYTLIRVNFLTREHFFIHSFTFINNKLKNKYLPCERLDFFVHTSFTRSHVVHTFT